MSRNTLKPGWWRGATLPTASIEPKIEDVWVTGNEIIVRLADGRMTSGLLAKPHPGQGAEGNGLRRAGGWVAEDRPAEE